MRLHRIAARTAPAVALATGALGCLAGAAAAGTFAAPQGCTPFMTVQMHGCVVSHHFRCAGDAPGDQWETLYDSDGPFFTTKVDSEFQWIDSYQSGPPDRIWLEEPARDPASFSNLIATGEDSYDFSTMNDLGQRLSYRGFDRLTGERVVIDGVTLEATQFELTESDEAGTVLTRRSGRQYINRDWRLFFSGVEMTETDEGRLPSDNTPVQFVMPGEEGYLSTVPLFDCDELMSQRGLPQEPDHG